MAGVSTTTPDGPAFEPADTLERLTVAVCTFRRPSLEDTLRSLAGCRVPAGTAVDGLVVDNDDEPTAVALAARVTVGGRPVRYIHAPGRNISIARNAALDAAGTRFVLFVDDDETVAADWLEKLWMRRLSEGADVVLGPVDAVYAPTAPDWMKTGDFHSTRPVFVNGRIITGYSCNVLIDTASPSLAGRRFAEELGRCGGEDTVFFHEASRAGAKIVYAEDALAVEPVSPARADFGWLLRRRFRVGQTHGRLLSREAGPVGRTAAIVVAAAKGAVCAVAAAPYLGSGASGRGWLLRGALHFGAAAALLGVRELELYRSGGSSDAS